MSRMWIRVVVGLAVVAGLVLAGLVRGSRVEAQSSFTGTWKASVSKQNSKINLHLERDRDKGRRSNMGQDFNFTDLQGLTLEQALNGGPANFSLVREAGRVDFEGSFQDGKGSGTFRFTPNTAFASAMKSRGFNFEGDQDSDGHRGDDRVFAATVLNVTTTLADDLTSAGFGKLGVDDLFRAAIFKIDSRFMREMKASGFEKEPFESLVKMQIFKVTPEFIAEVRNEGLSNLKVEDVVKLRIFKIDAQFIRDARADGVPLEVERLVQRKIGVAHR